MYEATIIDAMIQMDEILHEKKKYQAKQVAAVEFFFMLHAQNILFFLLYIFGHYKKYFKFQIRLLDFILFMSNAMGQKNSAALIIYQSSRKRKFSGEYKLNICWLK